MNHIIEYDEFINEGLITNKIELWKSKINSAFKTGKATHNILLRILSIVGIVGLVTGGLLWGILKICLKYPDFAERAAKQAGIHESSDTDEIAKVILNKFYGDTDLQNKIKEASESKNAQKIKEITTKMKAMFNDQELEYLQIITKNIS